MMLCVLDVGDTLQCEKWTCANAIFIILSADDYSWV